MPAPSNGTTVRNVTSSSGRTMAVGAEEVVVMVGEGVEVVGDRAGEGVEVVGERAGEVAEVVGEQAGEGAEVVGERAGERRAQDGGGEARNRRHQSTVPSHTTQTSDLNKVSI